MEMKEAYNVVLYTTYPSSNLIQTQNATTLFGSLKFGSPDLLREKTISSLENTAKVVLKNRMNNICVRSSICVRDRLEMHQDQMKLLL
jgi:predicted proteasome-type protease